MISAANKSLASRPAEIESTTDFNLDRRHALGAIDGLADRLFGLGEIDHTARLGAARGRMAEADHLDGMAPAGQHLLRRMRPQPRNQAGDLARADIERGNKRAAPRRDRLHLGRKAVMEGAHASPPFFFLSSP